MKALEDSSFGYVINEPQNGLNHITIKYPPYYKVSLDGEGMVKGGTYNIFSWEPVESLVEYATEQLKFAINNSNVKDDIHRKQLRKAEKQISDLKVVIDTLQVTLRRAKAVSGDTEHVFTRASDWALNYSI
jgi:hypothetical protein